MAYLDLKRPPNPTSMAAVVAIHGAIGAALIFGLTMTGIMPKKEIFVGYHVDPVMPPPPPPKPEFEPKLEIAKSDPIVPKPLIEFPTQGPVIDTNEHFPPQPPISSGRGEGLELPLAAATAALKPIGAVPRSDPSRWVSTKDYRSNWIRQEMTGKARFRLEIAADGRVASCTITGSSGFAALDQATCALVSKRAKFQPARGSEGQPVAATYTNAIDWQLPE